jgi:hypothetical protein
MNCIIIPQGIGMLRKLHSIRQIPHDFNGTYWIPFSSEFTVQKKHNILIVLYNIVTAGSVSECTINQTNTIKFFIRFQDCFQKVRLFRLSGEESQTYVVMCCKTQRDQKYAVVDTKYCNSRYSSQSTGIEFAGYYADNCVSYAIFWLFSPLT